MQRLFLKENRFKIKSDYRCSANGFCASSSVPEFICVRGFEDRIHVSKGSVGVHMHQ